MTWTPIRLRCAGIVILLGTLMALAALTFWALAVADALAGRPVEAGFHAAFGAFAAAPCFACLGTLGRLWPRAGIPSAPVVELTPVRWRRIAGVGMAAAALAVLGLSLAARHSQAAPGWDRPAVLAVAACLAFSTVLLAGLAANGGRRRGSIKRLLLDGQGIEVTLAEPLRFPWSAVEEMALLRPRSCPLRAAVLGLSLDRSAMAGQGLDQWHAAMPNLGLSAGGQDLLFFLDLRDLAQPPENVFAIAQAFRNRARGT